MKQIYETFEQYSEEVLPDFFTSNSLLYVKVKTSKGYNNKKVSCYNTYFKGNEIDTNLCYATLKELKEFSSERILSIQQYKKYAYSEEVTLNIDLPEYIPDVSEL
jgi:hypothetical protein